MLKRNRCAKINVKVLIIVIIVTVALGASLFAARQIRRTLLSKMSLNAGNAAFEKKDWPAAYRNFQEYLGRNPDDVEILKKYAKARLSIRPLEGPNINQTIAAYRRILQLDPRDETVYDELIKLYAGTGQFQELAYIARKRLEDVPDDRKAQLKLTQALFGQNKKEEAQKELEKLIKDINDIDADLSEKHIEEYVQACLLMSQIILTDPTEDKTKALKWLNQAVNYAPEAPESVEALASRARFYRATSQIPGQNAQNAKSMLADARKDLEKADTIGTENPRIRLFMAEEWILHGELEKAGDELQSADSLIKNLPQEKLEEYFFDINEWIVARFLLASRLAGLKGDTAGAVVLVDEALEELKERRHRVQILPTAVMHYVGANRVPDANECLDEYIDAIYTQQGQSASRQMLPYLQALVARGYGDPYGVINALQPFVTSGASIPEVWRLLAEAFIQTEQSRRAVTALIQYLRIRPQDRVMTVQLAKEYLKLQNWSKAFEVARLAEDPEDIVLNMLRIEASINISAKDTENNTQNLQPLADELVKLRTEHPDRVDIRILQAIVAVQLKDPNTAEKELKLAIEECAEPLRAEIQLVRFYRRTKRMDEAISTCQVACERNPEVAEPWITLSNLHVANSDDDAARNCLTKGMESVVEKWEKRSISMNLALLELTPGEQKDRDKGISILSDIAAQNKYEIRARILLLATPEIQKNQDRAQELIEELKEAEGQTGLQWRLHQANIWLASDEWRSKQQDIAGLLQYCIDADPQWSTPVLLMVNIYEKLNDLRRVEDICRQALTRNPSATDIAQKLVVTLQQQGRLSEAEKMLEQTEVGSQFTSVLNIGTALQDEDYSRAIDELKLRVSNNDQDALSRIQLAILIYQEKQNKADVNDALDYLDEAEAIIPGWAEIIKARVLILKAEGQDEEVRQILNNYVVDSNSFGAYMMRAGYLANEGELEFAEQDYRKLTTFAEQQGGAIGYELLANFYAGTEQIDKAIEELERGLNTYPENIGLMRGHMKLLFMRAKAQDNDQDKERAAQDKERAIEILTALEKQLPQDPGLMKLRALQLFEESTPESLKAARDKLENLIKSEPTAIDAHLVLIRMAMQEKEYENARNYAIRALGSNPDNSALLSARGRAELALANYQIAAELAKLVLQKDPNSTEARDVLVSAALKIGDSNLLEQARTLIESGIGSGPASEQLLISQARVMVALKSPQLAIPELKTYCQTGSGSVDALVTLADLYRLSGDMDQAKLWIEQAEQKAPNSQTALHARFIWLVAQERYEEIENISSAYISAKEQNPTTVLTAALVLTSLDSMSLKKEGVKLYEHALTLSPNSKDARLGLAFALYQTGDAERAKNTYQELLKQYPNDIQSLNDLAWILQEHDKDYEAALELANKGLRILPDEPHLLDTRGTILSNLPNRLADAKRDFQRLVNLTPADSPQQAKALLQLGRICAKLNELDQAKQHMEKALEIDRKIDVFTPDERTEITKILQ